ncbi:Zn-dependent hydrolase [Agrobacterium rubi]|uniref:Zn-dependent hydrolase n=1 Tax=Agrobacterium rubi TaxID=28099 RepID=A0AAE7UQP4_9HYPH|nr:Zn-dependent hydrolase [Agrobacterium rubi]NTE87876.1 Zn-dependent hydrolase [Agrobacterium rubi]NTF05126.1 Zn-dependent hydrolase [Agrobacterium rubi]NTF37969.1 Zn-dependent hydrolase [Agrobacterium rubi]QTG01824.1 Zn-dependent hydrolase [Agrobacterium rubi]
MANMQSIPTVDRTRLQADFDALADLTEPGRPWTRRSFTPLFLEGRAYLKARFEEEGLNVRTDAAGNLIGRWEGQGPHAPVLMTGSHSDTVPSGGRFDGIAGIISGLAAIRALRIAGYRPQHALELVDFLAEEPSEWGVSCIGSRGMAGALTPQQLALTGPDDERLHSAIDRIGGDVAELSNARRTDIASYLEIHIEQGPVLEARQIPIGIVTAIAGIGRVRVRLEGIAGHAGTSPMDMRADAALAMARFALAVRDTALAPQGTGHFTATIGVLTIEPGGANVVPGASEAIVDIRAEDDGLMDRFIDTLEALAQQAADDEKCRVALFERVSKTRAVACDPSLRDVLDTAARDLDLPTLSLASGAGHDAAFMAKITKSAMIFVPSRDGKSHTPDEWTENEAIALAADVLLRALVHLDSRMP